MGRSVDEKAIIDWFLRIMADKEHWIEVRGGFSPTLCYVPGSTFDHLGSPQKGSILVSGWCYHYHTQYSVYRSECGGIEVCGSVMEHNPFDLTAWKFRREFHKLQKHVKAKQMKLETLQNQKRYQEGILALKSAISSKEIQ